MPAECQATKDPKFILCSLHKKVLTSIQILLCTPQAITLLLQESNSAEASTTTVLEGAHAPYLPVSSVLPSDSIHASVNINQPEVTSSTTSTTDILISNNIVSNKPAIIVDDFMDISELNKLY